ncbi:MAG: VWA domain-containing protein [Pseudomonadales bacterium]|nr:VWA domain-containing protein [Pseudomonadales bacterium]
MFEFSWYWIFWLLPLPLLARFLLPATQPGGQAIRTPFFSRISEITETGGPLSSQPGWLQKILLIFAWGLLVSAAARPQWIGEPIELPTTGRDLMIAADISGSMKYEDLELNGAPATRLAVIQSVVGDFVKRRKGDRLGLILFGTHAYIQTPLTFDRQTLGTLLQEASIGIAGEQTAIGEAIAMAVKRLRDRPQQSRVLILLTGGQNTAGEISPAQATQAAAAEGVKIHTIGIGADTLTVRSFFGNRTVNPSAELDEKTLREISEATGGQYFRARSTNELMQIYQTLDQLEPIEQEAEVLRPKTELYPWPLGSTLLIFFLLSLININLFKWLHSIRDVFYRANKDSNQGTGN